MQIAINAHGLGTGFTVNDYQADMSGFLSNADSVISSFKTVNRKIGELSGGIKSLQGAADAISARIQQEETKKQLAADVQKKSNDFLELAVRVDKQVAADVNKNKNQFYEAHPWAKPPVAVDDTPWYEDAWNWLCDTGEKVVESAQKVWQWTKDTAKKAWDGLVEFYNEHWYDIVNWGVTILCAIGSIVAIALIPVTGGASILLVAGVSAFSGAIVAATRSITTQQRDKGTVDWGEVGKEALTAAVVGAVTGAIGAGVGGAITSGLSNTGLGASLLNSSSTFTRVLTGTVIGSTSEVASGMLTRGAAEATESLLETGTVDLGDVWDAATDPQQMVQDAVIGGASGGFSAAKAPNQSALDVDSEASQPADVDSNTSGPADIDNVEKPAYTKKELKSLRKKAVDKAWERERELVLQGKGTRDWTPSQQAELIKHHRVTGFEGQHMKNVDAFPEFAGDPNNIQFLTPAEHYYGAHGAGYDTPRYANATNGRFDPSTGTMIPFAAGESPAMPIIDLSSTVDPSQIEFLEKLGRPFGYGRYEDNMAGYHRTHLKKTP